MRKVALSRASVPCEDATYEASRAYRYPSVSEWAVVTQGMTFDMPAHASVICALIPLINPLPHVFEINFSVSLSLVP